MKKFRRIFREAERIEPSAGLWKRIEAGSRMRRAESSAASAPAESREGTGFLRIAAAVVLGVGLLGLGLGLLPKPEVRTVPAHAAAESAAGSGTAMPEEDAESVVDPDLMVWHADLGELELEAEEAEEVL